MKNPFILILVALCLSCGDDDASNSNPSESLVGQWKLTLRTIDGTNNPLEPCESFHIYTYTEAGTYSELRYAADANTPCLDNPSIEINGTWQKNNDSSYVFTSATNETSEFFIEFESRSSFTKTSTSLFNTNDPIIQTVTETFVRIE